MHLVIIALYIRLSHQFLPHNEFMFHVDIRYHVQLVFYTRHLYCLSYAVGSFLNFHL